MNWLIACEESGTVRDEFIRRGENAVSCDILPSRTPGPHYQGNVLDILQQEWDGLIAFPPCTNLSVSGAHLFNAKRADGRQQASVDFFMMFANATHIPRRAIENPVGIMSTVYRKPDQIIQPYDFGEDASKKTCLWLFGLPPLMMTLHIPGRLVDGRERWANQTNSGQNKLSPGPERAKQRSKTYPGIAKAMAMQWT